MHIDVYSDYLRTGSPQTPPRALRALLMRSGGKSIRVDRRYTEAYRPHEVMLNINTKNIYTKTIITCEKDILGQIYVGREDFRVRSIGHCALLVKDAIHLGTEADVSAHVLDNYGKRTPLKGILDTRAVLSVIPVVTSWRRLGLTKRSDRLRNPAVSRKQRGAKGPWKNTNNSLASGGPQLWTSFLGSGDPR